MDLLLNIKGPYSIKVHFTVAHTQETPATKTPTRPSLYFNVIILHIQATPPLPTLSLQYRRVPLGEMQASHVHCQNHI